MVRVAILPAADVTARRPVISCNQNYLPKLPIRHDTSFDVCPR